MIDQPISILIIDDSPDDRENYIRLLKKNAEVAFRCHETGEGQAGLAAVNELRPDCVLLDYSLPGANGLEVLKTIKAQKHVVPVILLTGQGSEAIAVQAIKLGADDYLAKSAMTVESLCRSIRIAIEHNYLQGRIDEQTALLLKNETRYQQLIDGLHDHSFCWIDKEGRVESWNSGAERMMGYSEKEIIGQPVSLFYTEEDRRAGKDAAALANALTTGKFTCDRWHMRKDGSQFWCNVQVDALRDNEGAIVGFIKVTHDITERREAELERNALMEKLMRSNTELERFAYVASHDMQEPVRMVMNFSRIIARDYADKFDEEGREYLQFVTESADRIHDMIDDLLDYARMGSEDTGMSLVDGDGELGHVLDNLAELIRETGAEVTHDVLPSFHGNPVQFMRLMQNLISNAIKYQPPGNKPVVRIGVEDQGDSWRLSVADNGLGVDEAFAEKIFEPFRRLHSWEQIKGTGLGLAVCRRIVENHGGRIEMKSAPGRGSTFFVILPKQHLNRQMVA
ncbi:MAG: response regulator [Alphaproteobacteria bacterium]|nr:response regulator [Alphaproteobacteria bacterium]